jgi:hypothetical protein
MKYQSNEQNVNVNVNLPGQSTVSTSPEIRTRAIYPEGVTVIEPNPYEALELPKSVEEYRQILELKDRQNNILKMILQIHKDNPFMFNKLVVARATELATLIGLIANADHVELVDKPGDVDCGCCGGDSKLPQMIMIDHVLITKGNEISNMKYHFAGVMRILDEYKISYRIVLAE